MPSIVPIVFCDLLVVLSCVIPTFVKADCLFNVINEETEKNQPVPLYNISSEYELAVPHLGFIHLKARENISLLCSGNRNYVRQTQSNVTIVTCIQGSQVQLYRKVYKFPEIQCRHIEKGDVRATSESCGDNKGAIYQIGYPISRSEWITLISVCYIPETGYTFYTSHVIHGREINNSSRTKYRPGFSTLGQYPNITTSLAYKQTYQKAAFSSILGSSKLAGQYINEKSYLARGHLSPDADFLLATAQFSTYYYINAAPQWQSINGASWKSIENTVRILAGNYGDLQVITGTHSVLKYKNNEDKLQEIYLGKNSILPVPKYFWKIVHNRANNKAIVFVILNDPFVKSAEEEVFCNDICEENGFSKKSWKDPSSGYVFCCNLKEFRKEVKTAPALSTAGALRISEMPKEVQSDLKVELI